MDGINCSVHFLTLKQVGYEESNVAVTFYHDRTHFDLKRRNLYAEYTEEFNLQQGRHFVLHNKLPAMPVKNYKLKDYVKELDTLLLGTSYPDYESTTKKSNQANENNVSTFYSTFQEGSIKKTIWLSPNRVLLLMRDSTFIWITIDCISGDLIKTLVDKTFVTDGVSAQGSPIRLSGHNLSDCILILGDKTNKPSSSLLIFVYSDKSKVDIIKFAKNSQLNEYISSWHDTQKLEKFSSFEPSMITYEFMCPTMYSIDKRLCVYQTPSSSSHTFSVWWPNDGQITWQPGQQQKNSGQTISLLERDDLRNNVLVLSNDLSDSNLMEHLCKSDGLLLSLHYTSPYDLLAVEQIQSVNQTYSINIYKYDLADSDAKSKSHKIKLTQFNIDAKIATFDQVKVSNKYILMLTTDQTLVLYEISRNFVTKYRLSNLNSLNVNQPILHLYNSIEWLVESLIFCVYNINGSVLVFDIAFNPIDLHYMARYAIKFKSISEHLNENIFLPFKGLSEVNSHIHPNKLIRIVSSQILFTESLWTCFNYTNGPFGLFRLSLPSKFNHVSLINHYLKNSQVYESDSSIDHQNAIDLGFDNPFLSKFIGYAVGLLNMLDWDTDGPNCLCCMGKIMNFILSGRVVFNLKTELLIEETLGSFYRPKRALEEKTIYEYKHQVSRFARRFFYKLLKHGSLNKAFLLAVDIGAKDLFNDLYYCALDKQEYQLAEVARKKYHEIISDENEKKIQLELNRSVTTIDDNIKGANTEFDRYSVSSSEVESIESDEYESVDLVDLDYVQLENRLKMFKIEEKSLNDVYMNNKPKENSVQFLQIPRTYTEEDIENYAKAIFNENEFINKSISGNLI